MGIIVQGQRKRLPKGSHKGRQMSHNQQTGKYNRQALRTAKNKDRARKMHLENHPNDLQAQNLIGKFAKFDQKFLEP